MKAYNELCDLATAKGWSLELHADMVKPSKRGPQRELTVLTVTADKHDPLSVDITPPNGTGLDLAAGFVLAKLELA